MIKKNNKILLLKDLIEDGDKLVYLETISWDGISFEIYFNDYGQSYILMWKDPYTEKINQWNCGTYNDNYQMDLKDIARYINERNNKDNGN